MIRLSLRAWVLAGVIGATPAIGGVIRHDQTDTWHQNTAVEPQFDGVGFLLNSATGSAGSGTLLTSEWVLTAAHVIDVLTLDSNSGFYFDLAGTPNQFVELHRHPNWDSANIIQGWDIGLARLAQPVTGVSYAELYEGPVPLGQQSTLVGYGLGGDGNTGSTPGTFGTKRAIQNTFDATSNQFFLGASSLGLGIDFDHPDQPNQNALGSATPLAYESFPGLGDSGGAYWLEENGTWQVASIQSWGLNRGFAPLFGGYGDIGVSTQVAPAIPWIHSITGVPEPGTALLLGGAVFLQWRGRRPH